MPEDLTHSASTRPIRMVTLNIAHGRGLSPYQGFASKAAILRQLKRIGNLINRLEPDIVCLQEVDEGSHWNSHLNLVEPILESTGFAHHFLGVHNRRHGRRSLAYGNAVLSRFPIHTAEVVAFGTRTIGEKGFIYAEIDLPHDGIVPLVNLHLDYRSRFARLAQIQHLSAFIEAVRGSGSGLAPVICGDFNARRGNRRDAVRNLFDQLQQRDRYTIFPERGLTFPSVMPVRGLDFILLPNRFLCTECRIVRTYVSDHRPVLLEFHPQPHRPAPT